MENEIQISQRNITIDVIKGLLAIFVVLGHITCTRNEYGYTLITDLCYSFHMFLFIAVSGYLIGSKEKNRSWYIKRSLRLLLPYLVWSIVYGLLSHHSFIDFLWNLFFNPYLWYLLVLFVCDSIVFIMEQIPVLKNKTNFIITGIIIFFIINVVYALLKKLQAIGTFKMLAIYFIFYFTGYIYKKYNIKNISKKLIYIFIIIYPFSMLLYQYNSHDRQERIARLILSLFGCSEEAENRLISILNPTGFVLYNHFVVAVLGCFFFIYICKFLSKYKYSRLFLSYIGNYTLQIYILSGLLILNFFNNDIINVIISFVLGIIVPIIIGIIFHHFNWLDRICFGNVKKSTNRGVSK